MQGRIQQGRIERAGQRETSPLTLHSAVSDGKGRREDSPVICQDYSNLKGNQRGDFRIVTSAPENRVL